MGQDDAKNLILAAVLSMLVVLGWYMLFPPAPPPVETPPGTAGEQQAQQGAGGVPVPGAVPGTATAPGTAAAATEQSRAAALAGDQRIEISTPAVTGSIRLKGGRLDDLHLSDYRVSVEPDSDTVVLLNPAGGPESYYVDFGWVPVEGANPGPMPDENTPWTIESGTKLTPESPVTLVWDNGEGLIFRREIAVDERYMFTMRQTVENRTGAAVSLAPYGRTTRIGGEASTQLWILHEGAIAYMDGELKEISYSNLEELAAGQAGGLESFNVGQNGWMGFTDKYWMTTLIADPGTGFDGFFQGQHRDGRHEFHAVMRLPVATVAPGATFEAANRLFAGAKVFYTLRSYERTLGIQNLHWAIDWGWFYFLTKPIFQVLNWLHGLIGNMGVAIILLTFIIKAILFPLAYKSYVSMSKMKQLQPEMEKIKERCGDDRQKMQQEMMALYKKEKVNPAAGCLPILLQIPIFFSLYKVLFVTIEMRHAPFFGWIRDLSAPDPTSWMNLFGLLPWDAPGPASILAILSIGVFPILMGFTMWLQQKLNPLPADPTQAMIFAWMPWVFMFMLGQFAVGLVIYWITNNTITFVQQYVIMRSQGVDVDLLGNIKSGFRKRRKVESKQ
jgi:YidC/Oxa1 family membrane protein insertase